MTTVTFDTYKFVKRLKSAGFEETQAEALADAQKDSFAETLETSIATKTDINHLEKEMIEIRAELKIIKWMIGFMLAGVVSLILKAFFA